MVNNNPRWIKRNGSTARLFLCFRGRKSNAKAYYHTEMIDDVFLDWLETKFLPEMKINLNMCALIRDLANYHTMFSEETNPPRQHWRKSYLASCISRWGGKRGLAYRLGQIATHEKKLFSSTQKNIAPRLKYKVQALRYTFLRNMIYELKLCSYELLTRI